MTDAARARALRFAFLVDPSVAAAPRILDAVFATCYGIYGGRFSLIVPCSGGQISAAYWSFLEVSDPDVVYSYVPVSDELEGQIHERLYPGSLIQHPSPRPEDNGHPHTYRPRFDVTPLTSLSILPTTRRTDFLRPAGSPVCLVDGWQLSEPDAFVMDNFGTRAKSMARWSPTSPEDVIARPLSFVTSGILANPHLAPRTSDIATFRTAAELLDRMIRERVVGMAQLSSAEVLRPDYGHGWSEFVDVFVGEDPFTRMAFWNCRLLTPAWLDAQGQWPSWRIGRRDFDDASFAQAFVEAAQRFGHVRSSGGSSPHLRLCSVGPNGSREEVQAVSARLQAVPKRWCVISDHHITSLEDCVPSAEGLKHVHDVEGGRLPLGTGTPWKVMTRSGTSISVPACQPQHLDAVGADLRHLRQGFFSIDCDLERSNNLSRYSNVTDDWRFPRRLRVAQGFAKTSRGGLPAPRANRVGLLTLYGTVDGVPFELSEPDDDEAMTLALVHSRPYPLNRHTRELPTPREEIAYTTNPSDCGKYLAGVIKQFGGVREAQGYLLHRFWAAQFEALGATPQLHERMVENVANRLAKRAPVWSRQDICDEERRRQVAVWALREASQERRAPRFVRFDDLQDDYDKLCRAYMDRHPPRKAEAADVEAAADEERSWRRDLTESLQYLCRQQILHQGYEWTCRKCLHRNWVGIDTLSRELECGVCGQTIAAPVDRSWQFRLNEFVQRAIRDHGIGPLVWALSVLQDQAMSAPMYFLGPTSLYFSSEAYDKEHVDAELDLLVVQGTEVILVEAKNSVRDLHPEQVIRPARRVRPSRLVVAVMEDDSPTLRARVKSIEAGLEGTPTSVELMTLNQWPLSDDPWLPGVAGRSVIRLGFGGMG